MSIAAVAASSLMMNRFLTAGAATGKGSGNALAAVAVAEYHLGDKAFTDRPDWPGYSEMKAVVHYPRRLAKEKIPLIVLLHGQNNACYVPDDGPSGWPCPKGVKPYPSYHGYDYLGRALAQDGFVVVSLSANGINHFMGVAEQRAKLINQHLGMWQKLTSSGSGPLAGKFTEAVTGRQADVDFRGRVDMTRVGLMGHSVGAQAVMVTAGDDNRGKVPAGVRIRGVVTLASAGGRSPDDESIVSRTSFAVVSSECWREGDREFFDNARGRTKLPAFFVRVARANHNFFNTAWTTGPGSVDKDDTGCPQTPNRPTAAQQQNFAATYLTAYYRLALKDDKGGMPVLTGARRIAGVDTKVDKLP
ncbi:hypothetical protein BG844_08730 [Couchioplanes caeruleus subsp. caeruleus]|uniref:Chlorophyllase-like protein n=1 Tax=Couchioplanes caeruleus subsp. caeruleus TaxID=56427 RepID=A0A1K0FP60_9ACTN|nr:hypothetical protein BG844_08730 [Couchioplanes caeruleus subsp. caeruleus]